MAVNKKKQTKEYGWEKSGEEPQSARLHAELGKFQVPQRILWFKRLSLKNLCNQT